MATLYIWLALKQVFGGVNKFRIGPDWITDINFRWGLSSILSCRLYFSLSCNIFNSNYHILSFLVSYFKYYYFINDLNFYFLKLFFFQPMMQSMTWSVIHDLVHDPIPLSMPGVWEWELWKPQTYLLNKTRTQLHHSYLILCGLQCWAISIAV